MSWKCAIIFAMVALMGRWLKGKWNNLLTIFAGFYTLTISLSSLRLWGINEPSVQACRILILGIFSYAIGYVAVTCFSKKRSVVLVDVSITENFETTQKYTVRKNIIYFALLIVVLFTVYNFIRAILLLRSGVSISQLRSLYYSEDEVVGARTAFDLYVYLPLVQTLVLVACATLFSGSLDFSIKNIF